MARILITGASGFIGGYLVTLALEKGHDVTAAVRPQSDRTRLSDPRLNLLNLSLNDAGKLEQQLRETGRFDWVIHNAGVTKALSHEGFREGNTENTRRLALVLQTQGLQPSKFLFVSSLAALGTTPEGSALIQAGQTPQPLTAYGKSKLETERFLESQPSSFPWVAVQPTAVYGPWERDILMFIKMANRGLELTIGRNSQRLSFVHAADVARAVFQILESDKPVQHRKFIVSDGGHYTTEDLGKAVREALGRKNTMRFRLPFGLVKQVAGISEALGRLQNKPSALSRDKLPELMANNWHCDASPLFEELNFKPEFNLYEGMKQTIQWYREVGWL